LQRVYHISSSFQKVSNRIMGRRRIQSHRGFSLVGMLVTMVCMVVLFVILMNSLNKAVTGQGSQQQGTVRSTQDELYLYSLYQSMAVFSNDNKGLYPVPSIMSGSKKRHVSTWMLIACGVWLVALGLYFIILRPPLLPEDARFMGTTPAQIQTAVPGLERWLQRVFTVMGGFMAGAGVLTVFVATVAMPRRLKGTSWAIALSGALAVVLMSVTNFALDSDFRWVLLVPAFTWLAGLVLYIAGR
jgi:hypothetical protein